MISLILLYERTRFNTISLLKLRIVIVILSFTFLLSKSSLCLSFILPCVFFLIEEITSIIFYIKFVYTVERRYNDIGSYDISFIASDILRYQLISHG